MASQRLTASARSDSESLQETLFELSRVEAREKRLREENDAILSAISAMTEATTKTDIFASLLGVIRRYVSFDSALALSRNRETEDAFRCLVATDSSLETVTWQTGEVFRRCVRGETVAIYKPGLVKELHCLTHQYAGYINGTALISGLTVNDSEVMLVLLSHRRDSFNDEAQQVLDRFRPLIQRTIMDIDYRHRLHTLVGIRTQELNASRQRFQDFAQTASDWFWELDNSFHLTYLSSPSTDADIDPEALLNKIKSDTALKARLERLIRHEKAFSDIEWHMRAGTNDYWVSLSGRPFYNKRGELVGYRGTAKDITTTKRRVEELQQARQQAELANNAKSQFLAVMSHEIRTPLNAVLGLIDALQHSSLNADQMAWVGQMDKSAQLLLTLISDVLDLSKIESNRFSLSPSVMRPSDSVTNVYQQLVDRADKKHIYLSVSVSSVVPETIFMDENRFTQILLNLIGNALKFTDRGGVTVSLDAEQHTLVLWVKDTGIGIEKNQLARIFDPFTQADGSITRRFGGTGLGLSICKKLVEMMGGTISVQSELNQGTDFCVRLPIIAPPDDALPPEQLERNAYHHDVVPPMTILVAEDSRANQMVVRLMLEKQGHRVILASNGEEAVHHIQQRLDDFDLVLMDMSMPVMDGIAATKALRMAGFNKPIIALTANAMDEDRRRCIQAGMNDFVTKPVRAESLHAVLSDYQPRVHTE
ncbi:hybrid sensor histidine kinase/response regulator [Salinivibrio sp. PR932]|uniref:hybrid sensor histidine kinase/response regulator n=1 Tax=Salinivibrio sp. PR932 TaxID=1909492 RepID=UPI0009899F0A|nr:PAS domain-containing hybrid sensor histidine kinase/response regulator [Salinivibrio sp. PR932]OOF17530.1 hybrid sensor histidine kinase/response regulator [Salinivibrio sp. PR932]